jgi:hypothetical protein
MPLASYGLAPARNLRALRRGLVADLYGGEVADAAMLVAARR